MDTITREKIIEALEKKGYVARATDKISNSIIQHGIAISDQKVCPVIYIDRYLDTDISKLDDITDEIINIYCANYSCDINVDLFTDKEFILSHLYIALQNKETIEEQLVKRDCELADIEEYLYIRGESSTAGNWSVKLTTTLVTTAKLSVDECWTTAECNTFTGETTIRNMAEVLFDMTGCEVFPDFDMGLYVISNKSGTKGSISILDKKAIKEWASTLPVVPTKLICICSSIHEALLIIPSDNGPIDLSSYSQMKQEVDLNEVAPEERLGGSNIYILDIE